jgi:hypothetical protein
MQKYLLYRKGVRIADIDRDEVKSGAQSALSDWIVHERLLIEGAGEREAFTFRFVEMRGYTAGYEGSCGLLPWNKKFGMMAVVLLADTARRTVKTEAG